MDKEHPATKEYQTVKEAVRVAMNKRRTGAREPAGTPDENDHGSEKNRRGPGIVFPQKTEGIGILIRANIWNSSILKAKLVNAAFQRERDATS